jgi:hypothetical protein
VQAGTHARLVLLDSVSAYYCVDRTARTAPLPEPHGSHLPQRGVRPLDCVVWQLWHTPQRGWVGCEHE